MGCFIDKEPSPAVEGVTVSHCSAPSQYVHDPQQLMMEVKDEKCQRNAGETTTIRSAMGDMKRFSTVQDHHVSRHGFECSFFTPDSRPHCVKSRYSLCEVTPVEALRGVDLYRKDGMRSSNLFKLWPIVLQEHQVKTPDLNLPRKQGKAVAFSKKYKRLAPRPRTIHGINQVDIAEQEENEEDIDSPGAGESLSRSQPSILVAVDTSGTGFYRMSSFRQSLKGTASLDRKKRRRTVSGVPDQIMHEIQVFERGKRNVRNTPRDYSFDDMDKPQEVEKDESMMQYIGELEAKMEEKAQQQRASREPKLLKYLPCRRSRSLPRCLKVEPDECQGVMVFEQEEKSKDKRKSICTAASGSNSSSLSLGSAGGSSNSSRATKRSNMIGSKIKSFVTGTLRPRPKSLDLDSIDVLGNDADAEDDSSSTHSKVTLQRRFSPSMPDDISSLSSSRESKVGPGTYYYFTSSTLPRTQARKYDFPWESLPKDWTTSVRLREISKRRRVERNSSSGNWSGSSNRQSLDSARSSTVPSSTSQYSLGRDSGRDSPSMGDDKDPGEQAGKDTGTSTFMPLSSRVSSADDTEQWLASLAKRAAAREDVAAAGSDVTDSLTRLSQLTKQNIQALEDTFSPQPRPLLRLDDELSSVHSLDQDGFYTSFHNDSGLRRSIGTLLDDSVDLVPMRKTHSLLSIGSNNTIDSVIFRPLETVGRDGDSGSAQGNGAGKLRPPPPLRCGSRLSSTSSLVDAQEKLKSVGEALAAADVATCAADSTLIIDSVAPGESSQSESDQETIYTRLRAKTKISSRSIPSWCVISDEDSTDSSSVCLNRADPKSTASVSLVKTLPGGDAISKSSPLTDSSCTLLGSEAREEKGSDELCDCSSLPRRYLDSKVWEEDVSDHCNSWPRSRRPQQPPVAGILKRDKSPAESLKPKILNFAPVVNMFDHHTSQGIELPLHAASSTSSSSSVDGSSDASTKGLPFKLSMPLLSRSHTKSKSQGDLKQQPTIASKLGQKFESVSKPSQVVLPHLHTKPSAPSPQLYAVSEVKGMREGSSESSGRSVSSSESSLPSLSDCGQGGYLDMSAGLDHRSLDTCSSSSSAALSDLDMDSSLTYVTMSSSSSTPTNSALTLCPDDQPTPVNSPRLQHDTYRISPVTLSGAHLKQAAPTDSVSLSSGPGLKIPLGASLQAPSQTSRESQAATERQSLGSFSAHASTEAAPASWVEERSNNRTTSEDSGFSSPTTPTTAMVGPHHHHHHQHLLPQSAKRMAAHATQVHKAEVHNGDVVHKEDGTKVRTPTPPQLSIGQKHERLRAFHRGNSPMDQSSTPRSDSYRAATKDLNHLGRRSSDGSLRHKTRSQSTAEMAGSSPSQSPQHIPLSKSISCPTGVLADVDGVTRADSYRYAVRNTQGIVGDVATRNTSYRMATREDDPVPDDRMDAANTWSGRRGSGSRDMRRMGITDIDQLKCYDSDSSSSRTSSSSLSAKSSSKGFAGINSSRKKMKPEVQNLLRGDKTPSPEVKRMTKVSGKNGKDKEKAKTSSSTYIRFDPIFEQVDDMYSSTDTLRAESVEMIASEEGYLMGNKVVGQLPPGKVRAGGGRRQVDEKAVMSILDSIKTTIKSMSGKSSADKDSWKYEGGG